MRSLRLLEDMSETWEIRDGLRWLEEREKLSRELQGVDRMAEQRVNVKLEGE